MTRPYPADTIEARCRALLHRAAGDGLLGHAPPNAAAIEALSAGDLTGVANMLAVFLAAESRAATAAERERCARFADDECDSAAGRAIAERVRGEGDRG